MKTRTSVLIVGFLMLAASASRGAAPNADTRAFLQAHPGTKAIVEADRLVAIHGATFASDSDPNTTTDQFVAAFLTQNGTALGVQPLDLVLKDTTVIRFGQTPVYTYTQRIEGLPVYASVIKIPVALGATEKIGYIGIRLVPPPATPLPPDVVTDQQAVAQVANGVAYAQLTTYTQADKVIFEADDGTLHRAWRFSGYDDDESWLFFVDTNTGALVAVYDEISRAEVSGRVTGHPTPCCSAHNLANPDSCPDLAAGMPGVQATIDLPGIAPVYADDDGNYTFLDIPGGQTASLTTRLIGKWVSVVSSAGFYWSPTPGSRTITTSDDQPVANVNFIFNPTLPMCTVWPSQFATAHVNAFDAIQRTHNWFRQRGGSVDIDRQVTARVNAGPDCFASYNHSAREIRLDQAGDACNNASFSTVISHEYGHFIVRTLVEAPSSPFNEGAADTVAALFWGTPLMGVDFERGAPFIRNIDEPNVSFGLCTSLPAWCPYCDDSHCSGLALSGAFWDLRGFIGAQATEELFTAFLEVTDGVWGDSIPMHVLVADDDNGDLSDGTPHQGAILNSFTLHGWDNPVCPPGSAVKVAWDGPPFSVIPVEGVDYEVDDVICPPVVILKSTVKDTVPIVAYSVGRTESDGSPASIETVIAEWATPANQNIIVEVGMRPTEPCRSVGIVDIPAQSASNWSSLRLNLAGHLKDRVACRAATTGPDAGQGGRLSGTITGNAGAVTAEAIGDGASAPGTLLIGAVLKGSLLVGYLPDGSLVDAYELDENVIITKGFHGTVHTAGHLTNSFSVFSESGPATGDILVGGYIMGGVGIHGDMDGDIIANADGVSNGQIAGPIIIQGAMRGNICASNLSTGIPLPENILVGCGLGPNATICGQAPSCPVANILTAVPLDGTRDARQPHPIDNSAIEARQGIGSPNPDAREEDKIKLTLNASGLRAISHNCWSLCETSIEPVNTGTPALSSNKISCIKEPMVGGDEYQIVLERPISGRHWTRIRYLGGEAQEVSYASLPANANGDDYSTPVDILDHIDCCLNCTCHDQCWNDLYRCDIDRNGLVNFADNRRLVDLLQGEGNFIVWNGQPLSINTCESGYPSGGGGGGGGGDNCANSDCGGGTDPMAMALGGGGGGLESTPTSEGASDASLSSVAENAYFADWFVNYLTTTNPADSSAEEAFLAIVDSLAQWCVDQFTPAEQAALAERLNDPTITFVSEAGAESAAGVVEALSN